MTGAAYQPNQVMVDLETLDTAPTAIVLSIGLCRFDPNDRNDPIREQHYVVLSYDDQFENLRTISDSTVSWWESQGDEAKAVIAQAQNAEEEVHLQLVVIADWLGDDAILWGNGAAFDNAILADLYRTYEFKQPWSFKNDRCYRTLAMLGQRRTTPAWMKKLGPEPAREGTYHNALDDAVYQARMASRYMRVL